ncbi:methylglutaconyl-CoA hydratase, mitochondrial precursor, putative [Trypanosoma brucei gambiense DAL972]|uniref:Methylglutaconyl-CoA hydratase, mitochondrial, putative n=2 Tax=Trypanosoma brucei TaxID=5691 RepID=D0A2C1_TRYB9|nr:methylglutaconyl-CoA hydratase, mitochondrial precursor, putative [Trypanosoma brucei gambiense DAL972]RHW69784.1 methylglutaconyl-CoA hydratase [Trypanosoma brucei equiperdum]CBH15415.1 methylglutaconyl-CoA hydratase, mitochondrial precursor, putative [Trypanosoma brucei gambiense DAL972]|eukprot:XP_011777679.1 methylglutaconyl-CoA hydratase, mitochondrial precursor, putative [Trypanosoma brucei gambiense DAL972]
MRRCPVLLAGAVAQVVRDGECSLTRVGEHIGLIGLNRPARKNAIGRQLLSELKECICYCRNPENQIRCVIVESRVDGVFCAGADLKERRGMTLVESRAYVEEQRDTLTALEDLSQPTISAIEGAALGGGCELALCTDIRIAGAGARFGLPETGLAIIPGAGGTYRAPLVMGLSNALQLILTADVVPAERAQRLGLVTELVPAGGASEAALAVAGRIARNGPVAVAAAKAAVRGGFGRPRDEALDGELRLSQSLMETQDRMEGLQAFAEKRPPRYVGK